VKRVATQDISFVGARQNLVIFCLFIFKRGVIGASPTIVSLSIQTTAWNMN
jgi:hypothetical protein